MRHGKWLGAGDVHQSNVAYWQFRWYGVDLAPDWLEPGKIPSRPHNRLYFNF